MPQSLPLFSIEPASWRDLNSVRQIEKTCFPLDAWPLFDLIAALTLPHVTRFKAVAQSQTVGFIAADGQRSDGAGWIATVAVLPAYQGRGIGTALIETCEQAMKQPVMKLCVRAANVHAIRLYQKLGYREVGLWPRYYDDGENALVMEKRLRPGC